MKKLLILMLSSLLVMTCCTKQTPLKNETPPNDENRSETSFQINGELPEIGVFTGVSEKERFYEDLTDEFIPSDEYGVVVPFIASYKIYETSEEDWHASQGYASYGFCNADGKIIVDANDGISYVNYMESDDGFGYYNVSFAGEEQNLDDVMMPSRSLIIPSDGSWSLELPNQAWVSSVGEGVITVSYYEHDSAKTVLYDYEGKELATLYGIDSVGTRKCGLMMVYNYDSAENKTSVYYINDKGERVLGPYMHGSNFNDDGYAYICDFDDEMYYIIDRNGNKMSNGYSWMNYDVGRDGKNSKNHVFVARIGNQNITHVFSRFGTLLSEIPTSEYISFRFSDSGEIVYYYSDYSAGYSDAPMVWKRLFDHSDVVSLEYGVSPNQYEGTDNLYLYIDTEIGDNGKHFGFAMNEDGKTVAAFDDINSFMDISDDARFLTYETGIYDFKYDELLGSEIITDTRQMQLYDVVNKKTVYNYGKSGYARFVGKDDRFVLGYTYEGIGFGANSDYSLYDTKKGTMFVEGAKYIEYISVGGKDYFNVCSKNANTLYDSEMNVIHRNYTE